MEMKVRKETAPPRKRSSRAVKLWMAFFVLLAGLVYSPWVAPYDKHEPFILGLPYTLFWWLLLSFLLLVSILLFVVFVWREEDQGRGRD